jgi:hypothetical protein
MTPQMSQTTENNLPTELDLLTGSTLRRNRLKPVLSRSGYLARIKQSRHSQNASTFGICIALKRKVRRAKQKRNKRMGWQHTWATKGESSKEYPAL